MHPLTFGQIVTSGICAALVIRWLHLERHHRMETIQQLRDAASSVGSAASRVINAVRNQPTQAAGIDPAQIAPVVNQLASVAQALNGLADSLTPAPTDPPAEQPAQ